MRGKDSEDKTQKITDSIRCKVHQMQKSAKFFFVKIFTWLDRARRFTYGNMFFLIIVSRPYFSAKIFEKGSEKSLFPYKKAFLAKTSTPARFNIFPILFFIFYLIRYMSGEKVTYPFWTMLYYCREK